MIVEGSLGRRVQGSFHLARLFEFDQTGHADGQPGDLAFPAGQELPQSVLPRGREQDLSLAALQALGQTQQAGRLNAGGLFPLHSREGGQNTPNLFVVMPMPAIDANGARSCCAFPRPSGLAASVASSRSAVVATELRMASFIHGSSPAAHGQMGQGRERRRVLALSQTEGDLQADFGIRVVCHRDRFLQERTRLIEPGFGQTHCVRPHCEMGIVQRRFDQLRFQGSEPIERTQGMQPRLGSRALAQQLGQRPDSRRIAALDQQPLRRLTPPGIVVAQFANQFRDGSLAKVDFPPFRHPSTVSRRIRPRSCPAISDSTYCCCKKRGMAE